MQKFKYTAVNLKKEKIKGTFIARDEKDLVVQLANQGLFLTSYAPYSGATPSAFFTWGTGKVDLKEITAFCREFSIMLNTHVPILDCLNILRKQQFSGYFKKIIKIIHEDVKSGMLLSEAIDKHEKVFPDFFRSMIYVGERSGKMDEVFNSLANYYERDAELRRKTKSALAYPIMLLFMTVAILILMFALVVPTFRETLDSLNVAPSGLTKAVFDIADFFKNYWNIVVLAIMLLGITIFFVLRTESGRYFFDWLNLKLPFIKTVQWNMITARFARGFALLLASGMDLNDALDAIDIVLGNRYIRKRFGAAAERVRQGTSLTVAFGEAKLFPPMMLQMITVGEKTASLDEVLIRSCNFFDTQVETSLNSVISKIQPIMLLIMGGIVATLFVAVYSPMLSIMNGLN